MELNSEALYAACLDVARSTLWSEPPNPSDEIDALAHRFYAIAISHSEFIADQSRDPNLLVHAIRYLAYTHAIPPMKSDTRWFQDMLEVLVELACPNSNLPPAGKNFLREIRTGLKEKAKA